MKFWEAMKAAEEGKLVRAKSWSPKCYWGRMNSNCCAITLSWCFWEEWEIYDESEQTLSFAEVVKGLKEGKRFKRKEWHKDMAVCCCTYQKLPGEQVDNEDLVGYPIEGHLEPLAFSIGDFEATDWVEV